MVGVLASRQKLRLYLLRCDREISEADILAMFAAISGREATAEELARLKERQTPLSPRER